MSYKYQWRANGSNISGATSSIFTPTASQAGKRITVVVTASGTGYTSGAKESAQTSTVAKGDLAVTANPSITGSAKVDSNLTAVKGTFSPTPDSYAYQWLADGTPIVGATGASYTPTPADAGRSIAVQVTARKSGYNDRIATSATTSPVALGDFAATASPSITGNAEVGETLTASDATWRPSPDSTSFQWLADGLLIDGATSSMLGLTADLANARISVLQTAVKAGYQTASAESPQTEPVVGGEPLTVGTPTIAGIPEFGETLVADPGTWGPEPVDLTYQWNRNHAPIAGATGPSYTLTANDIGTMITVTVKGRKPDHIPATATSDPAGPVEALQFSTTPTPTISGTPRLDETLTAQLESWSPTPDDLSIQWNRTGWRSRGPTARPTRRARTTSGPGSPCR